MLQCVARWSPDHNAHVVHVGKGDSFICSAPFFYVKASHTSHVGLPLFVDMPDVVCMKFLVGKELGQEMTTKWQIGYLFYVIHEVRAKGVSRLSTSCCCTKGVEQTVAIFRRIKGTMQRG